MNRLRVMPSHGRLPAVLAAFLLASIAHASPTPMPCEYINRTGGDPLGGGMGLGPGGGGGEIIRHGVGLRTRFYSYDTYEGEGLDKLDATITDVIGTFSFGDDDDDTARVFVGFSIPYLAVDTDATLDGDATGFGDSNLGVLVNLSRANTAEDANWPSFGYLDVAVVAPTGSETEGLGHGDWVYHLGWLQTWGRDENTWQLRASAGHSWNMADQDMATWEAGFGAIFTRNLDEGVARFFRVGIFVDAIIEYRDGIDMGAFARDAAEQFNVGVDLSWDFFPGSGPVAWRLTAGARSGLGNDGLRDRFTPVVGITYRWGPQD